MYIYICIINVCKYVHVYTCARSRPYIHIYVHTYIYVYIYIYKYICVCVFVCVCVDIYIRDSHIHTYTHPHSLKHNSAGFLYARTVQCLAVCCSVLTCNHCARTLTHSAPIHSLIHSKHQLCVSTVTRFGVDLNMTFQSKKYCKYITF